MNILKGEKIYNVKECKDYWNVSLQLNAGASVNYHVDKELCNTEEALIEYVKNDDMF